MRRIKSAPANLCSMCHNIKIPKKSEPKIEKCIIYENKIKDTKKMKTILSTTNNIVNDVLNDTNDNILPFEINYIIGLCLTYFSENIIKKDKVKNLQSFIIQNTVRFIITYFLHKHVLIEITNTLHLP